MALLHRLLVILLVTSYAVLASPVRSEYAVKDAHHVPSRWSRVQRADPGHMVILQIGLTQSRFRELERHLYEVSDPSHRRYGQHLTIDEVNELVKPTEDALELVHEWLAEHGIDASQLKYSPARDWIAVRLPVSHIERLLNTEYFTFVHNEEDIEIVRAPEWSLPMHLHKHIATIQPTNSFFRPKPVSKLSRPFMGASLTSLPPLPANATIAAACNVSLVTPLCLRALYGTVNYAVKAAGKNTMALNDFLGELNNRSDASIYLQKFRPEAAAAAYQFEQISIAGGTIQQSPENATQLAKGTGIEGALDVQTMLGIAWPTPLVAYSTGGLNPDFVPDLWDPTDTDEPYITWLQYILA